jgi:hypothetical protein
MQNTEIAKNTNNDGKRHLPGRPYYDNENGTGLCPTCVIVWPLKDQIMYTTVNKTRTYGICPKCKTKTPLRKKPRTRDGFLARFPPKRIE